jgi:hypothetical protein
MKIEIEEDGTICFNFTNEPDCPCCKMTMEEADYFREEKHLGEYIERGLPDDATHVCLDCGFAKLHDGQMLRW